MGEEEREKDGCGWRRVRMEGWMEVGAIIAILPMGVVRYNTEKNNASLQGSATAQDGERANSGCNFRLACGAPYPS